MKKLVSAVALLAIMLTMVSCMFAPLKNPIKYEKKYIFKDEQSYVYYVFEKDQTGYCEYYDFDTSHTRSGRVEFVWREASDGAVYLFRTKTSYNEDHTEGVSIPLIDGPIHFSKDFFVFSYNTQFGSANRKYIMEGSKLRDLIED